MPERKAVLIKFTNQVNELGQQSARVKLDGKEHEAWVFVREWDGKLIARIEPLGTFVMKSERPKKAKKKPDQLSFDERYRQ